MTRKNFGIANAHLASTETVDFQNCKHDIGFFFAHEYREIKLSLHFPSRNNNFPISDNIKTLLHLCLFCILISKQIIFNKKWTIFET